MGFKVQQMIDTFESIRDRLGPDTPVFLNDLSGEHKKMPVEIVQDGIDHDGLPAVFVGEFK